MKIVIATNPKANRYELHRDGCAHLKTLFPHYLNGAQDYESIGNALMIECDRIRTNGGDQTKIVVAGCLKMSLTELAARIDSYLKRFEADPVLSKGPAGRTIYYEARAWQAGRYVAIIYVSYQSQTNLSREEAEAYLAWLDAGHVGTHFKWQRETA